MEYVAEWKGDLLFSFKRKNMRFLILFILSFSATIISLVFGVLIQLGLYQGYSPCCFTQTLIFFIITIVCSMFIKTDFRIYERGMDLPIPWLSRLLTSKKTFVTYQNILAIYPGYFHVAIGPGAYSDPDGGGSLGKTTLMGINIDLMDGRTKLVKFHAHQLMDPKDSDDDCIYALNTLATLYAKNGWDLVKTASTLTMEQKAEYKKIAKQHFSKYLVWEMYPTYLTVFGIMIGLFLSLRYFNIELTGSIALVVVFIAILPLLFAAGILLIEDKKRFKDIHAMMRSNTYEKQEMLKKYYRRSYAERRSGRPRK
jgi:hypothetical protein